ncbi:glycosyltransferase [Sphingobacterium multivorum]|uniref:glycosyltransferase n=1 Tax=Sphingobacterium multivorum TaxID=28454 RepID=UPI000EE45592|nr:glycosyltransferase [Sphingobacterium multivorum]HAF36757.1 glycosyl transferase family 28 [Sphingobacterium sp.]
MIFIITGTQEPFDRLLKLVKKIIPDYFGEIVIQAKTDILFHEKHVKVYDFLEPDEFKYFFEKASLIVSHAGMGTIISALSQEKPILIFPRKVTLREHRNDHQLATAKKMIESGYVYVAMEETEFLEKLRFLIAQETVEPLYRIGPYASFELLNSISQFIDRLS